LVFSFSIQRLVNTGTSTSFINSGKSTVFKPVKPADFCCHQDGIRKVDEKRVGDKEK